MCHKLEITTTKLHVKFKNKVRVVIHQVNANEEKM